ncbi:hypothetical protein [Streptomyces sp. NPDC006134]|uniref:hypothetical protein n=1 Tax=Streptomyces sp. NPDC006134 TaxID=3154467 RepID=UPI00340C6A51
MDAGAVAAALEEARFDARQASWFEDLADDVRGRAELAEWERLAQLLAAAPSGIVYDPDTDEVVQAELAADAAAAAAREEAAGLLTPPVLAHAALLAELARLVPGADVDELAFAASAPGPPLRRILAGMEPLVEHERPHVCGQSPVVPPGRPALPPQPVDAAPVIRQPLPANDAFGDPVPVRYSLEEAWKKGILPWKAPTARTSMRRRSPERGIPVPEGRLEGQTVRYTEDELTTWRAAWEKQAGPTTGRPPARPESASR